MPQAEVPRVLLCAADFAAVDDVRRGLEQTGHVVALHALDAVTSSDAVGCHLIILEAAGREPQALPFCRPLRARTGDAFVPVLLITGDPSPAGRLAAFEAGADAYLLRPFASGELLAQVRALLRIKAVHDHLAEQTAEVHRAHRRLQQAYQQLDQELELAGRIQHQLLPHALPEVPRARFAAHHRSRGRVGGDCCDAFRLDERHVGFYVADTMGHGVLASLLTVFVQTSVRPKEVLGRQYRLVPPDEVLQHLNRELVRQALPETPFLTMAYVLYNHDDGVLRFARAGHPCPLYLPRDGEPCLWQAPGSLLGVFDTDFAVQTHQLRPGDKVLLYSDGIDDARFADHPPGAASLLACAARHRTLPVAEFVSQLAHDLFAATGPSDDLTLLGLERERMKDEPGAG